MATAKLTWTQKADRTPPWFCRWVARHKGTRCPKTVKELSKETGLSQGTIQFLSKQSSWANINHMTAERFSTACGVDFQRQKRILEYVKVALTLKGGLAHVNKWHNPRSKNLIYKNGKLTPMVTEWIERMKGGGKKDGRSRK